MFVKKIFMAMIPHEKKFKIDSVAVNILIPYPGTEFYKKFCNDSIIDELVKSQISING